MPDEEFGPIETDYGTPQHAAKLTEGRHQGTRDAMQWLAFSHLPPALQDFSEPLYTAAHDLLHVIGTDSPELTTALNTLVTAKDSAMRAGIRHQTGRAGSVPRPQKVVDAPILDVNSGSGAAKLRYENGHLVDER